jgi:hypothetical protein
MKEFKSDGMDNSVDPDDQQLENLINENIASNTEGEKKDKKQKHKKDKKEKKEKKDKKLKKLKRNKTGDATEGVQEQPAD